MNASNTLKQYEVTVDFQNWPGIPSFNPLMAYSNTMSMNSPITKKRSTCPRHLLSTDSKLKIEKNPAS